MLVIVIPPKPECMIQNFCFMLTDICKTGTNQNIYLTSMPKLAKVFRPTRHLTFNLLVPYALRSKRVLERLVLIDF